MWQNLKWEINAKFKEKIHRHVSPFQVIILGFMLVILLGSLCLTLPLATRDGQGASFLDALFTSTSAVCVTGLVPHDTASYWSVFGQAVILFLIQIGGMGVVTVSVAVAIFSGRKISLMQRSTMRESISAPQVGGIVRMTEFILKTVFLVELLGAVAMAPVFVRDFGFLKGVWYAMFHSISAFCNAGFDLMGIDSLYSSVTAYVANPLVNIAIMSLIVIGGIVSGIFTATEGAGVAVLYCLILSIIYKSIDFKGFLGILLNSAKTSGIILFLISASSAMSFVMAYSGIPAAISNGLMSLTDNKYIIFLLMNIILLVIGMFMDITPAILIFTPIFLPIATSFGMTEIQFGVMLIFNMCLGNITPPVGSVLFVGCGIGHVSIEQVTSKLIPYFAALVAALLAVTYIPALSLGLPSLMGLI